MSSIWNVRQYDILQFLLLEVSAACLLVTVLFNQVLNSLWKFYLKKI